MQENQPKSIEDYKDVIRILKLKIIKQNKKIQQLETKVKDYQEQIDSVTKGKVMKSQENIIEKSIQTNNEFDTSKLKGKATVMYLFLKSAKTFGITLQSIFRIANFNLRNEIESDYFRTVLSKMKLNLTPKQISCLIFIFDQNCTGFISQNDYNYTLHAYQVGLQQSCLPYTQDCLLKLVHIIHTQKLNWNTMFDEMSQKSKKQIDVDIFQQYIKKKFLAKMQEKQIMGAFNQIDLESQGSINRTNFNYCLTSFMNRLLLPQQDQSVNKGSKLSNLIDNRNHQNYSSHDDQSITVGLAKGFESKLFGSDIKDTRIDHQQNINQSKQQQQQQFNRHIMPVIPQQQKQNNKNNKRNPLEKLQTQYGLRIGSIYESILKLPFNRRITLNQVRKILLKLNPKLSTELIGETFKQIDEDSKGSIYITELLKYYLINSQDSEIVFRLLGKYFFNHDLSSEKFWFMFGLTDEMDISKEKFLAIMEKTFPTRVQGLWLRIWEIFDKGSEVVAMGNIIKLMSQYDE